MEMVKTGLRIGVVAAVISGGAMLLFRLTLGAPSLPEVLIDLVTALLPMAVFSFFIEALGGWAKPLLVAGLVIAQLLAGGVFGVAWLWGGSRLFPPAQNGGAAQRGHPTTWRWWAFGLAFSVLLWILAMVTVLPAAGRGAFGARPGLMLPVSWLICSVVYGGALAGLSYRRQPPSPQTEAEPLPVSTSRRQLVRNLGLVALGAVLAAGLGRYIWMAVAETGRAATNLLNKLPPEITPNGDFYTVSKNIDDPSVNGATWKLTLDGLVEHPLTLTYEQLKALPPVTQYLTLECISNEVGGDLMGNAQWVGVPLGQLLKEAGVKGQVRKVVLHAADDYSDSITLEKALEPGTIIAYEMNGEPLPEAHGFPARLLVPEIYGMKNVKWLTRIELVDYDFQGYWQQRGWSDRAVINTTSRIDVPKQYKHYTTRDIEFVGGVAFASARGIAQVEVSTDDGKTWTRAEVKEALSPYTWVLWTKGWTPPGPGSYTLKVRATDRTGAVQSSVEREPLPDGATGYHAVVVRIVEK